VRVFIILFFMGGNVKILLATHNAHKAEEIQQIWRHLDLRLLTLEDCDLHEEIIEDGDTLEANALIKARYAFAQTGIPAVADDTGLEVDALNGAPGVYSARYAGEKATFADNNAKLIAALAGVPQTRRQARFRTAVALVTAGDEIVVSGICEGCIIETLTGEGGFGYDPIFLVPTHGKTFAQMTAEEKNAVSHRGRGFRAMAEVLKQKVL